MASKHRGRKAPPKVAHKAAPQKENSPPMSTSAAPAEPGRPKGKNPALANESLEARFLRLGRARYRKALKAIESLQALASPRYKMNPEQVSAIDQGLTRALETAITLLGQRARGEGAKKAEEAPLPF